MSNLEHLIENALTAMEENPKDTYQAFVNEIRKTYNQQMLKEVSITEFELWEIAQYIVYTWLANLYYKDLVPQGEWVETEKWRFGAQMDECSVCGVPQILGDINSPNYCPNCGARMKGGE